MSHNLDKNTEVLLTLKMPITTAADEILNFSFYYFSEKISLNISCELSAKQTIHMKYQYWFSLKRKKKIEGHLLEILLGALRINFKGLTPLWF